MRCGDTIRGFTLIELCCVLVIVGILAALAGPRLLASPAFEQRGYTDELAAALRTAEAVALASGCDVQLSITPGGGYSAKQPRLGPGNTCSGPFTVPVARPDGSPLSGAPPSGANVTARVTLIFGPQGTLIGPAPVADPTSITVVGTPTEETQPLTLQVDPLSGFVTVP